jgi:hypothetical protein
MNARWVSLLVVISLVGIDLIASPGTPAQAEWYRPSTWGGKKPTVNSHQNSHQKKKNTGVIGGTKRALSKTADALTPWDNKKKKNNPHEGAGRFFRPDIAHRQKQNESTWYRPATWFKNDTQPEKPLTVTDWMAQDRPEFENR